MQTKLYQQRAQPSGCALCYLQPSVPEFDKAKDYEEARRITESKFAHKKSQWRKLRI